MDIKKSNLQEIKTIPLKIIPTLNGSVLHALKSSEESFFKFGEAYFSFINSGEIKGWKRHKLMTLNLIVPVGEIRFVIFDNRSKALNRGKFIEIILSKSNYQRLSVPPMTWMAFQGIGKKENMLLNIANLEHNKEEVEEKNLREIPFKW